MKKLFLLLSLSLSMGTALAADNFVLCTDASQLKEGSQIYIGDPNNDPQTLMGAADDESTNKQPSETATIEDGVVTNAGNGALLTLESAGDGKWYIKDSSDRYLYGNHTGNNIFFKSDLKSEFIINIDSEGVAEIYYEYNAPWGMSKYYIYHSLLDGDLKNCYVCVLNNTSKLRYNPSIYVKEGGETPVVPAPQAVTFSAEGEVEAGTVVTITAKGATHIAYTYNGASDEANGESINVTINEAGTVNVTATNEGGSVTGAATYTIKAVVPTPEAPENVTFSVIGEVEAGTVVTITAKGATHIAYTYNGATGEANDETINVTINEAGTVNVTASNDGGTVTGQAEYTIKSTPTPPAPVGTVLYSGLEADAENIDWVFDNDMTWMWMYDRTNDYHYLDAGFDEGIAYEPNAITLPDAEQIVIIATFQQNTEIADAAFVVRENGTTAWTELPIVASRAALSEATVILTDYAGKTIQFGLKFPGGEDEWMVNNLKISSKEETGIDSVVAAENANAVYYNLQGVRVNADAMTPGIYVRLEGKKATKVLVR